jgi:UDP-2-acetamido-3-amino-2,3-dideoxy-glucuronate N-acetyltransferase
VVVGAKIGENAFVGPGAMFNKGVKLVSLTIGVSARQIGWVSGYGDRIFLPSKGKVQYTCSHSGHSYILHANDVQFSLTAN